MMKKNKLKKLGKLLGTGVKKTGKAIKKYGPRVSAASRRMADTAMDALAPSRTRTVVDLTPKRRPKRIYKGKKGFYLDYS